MQRDIIDRKTCQGSERRQLQAAERFLSQR
jgi:hypothetical protein